MLCVACQGHTDGTLLLQRSLIGRDSHFILGCMFSHNESRESSGDRFYICQMHHFVRLEHLDCSCNLPCVQLAHPVNMFAFFSILTMPICENSMLAAFCGLSRPNLYHSAALQLLKPPRFLFPFCFFLRAVNVEVF